MFSAGYRWWVLVLLTAVYTMNLVDRGLMSLLLEPIRLDLHLSDTQVGFVTGIAFGTFYATFGIPMARWSDKGDRSLVTSCAIGIWGLTVMSCLLVGNYVQLIVARMAAAVGEAGCKPPTYSLVGDYFPQPRDRTRAMAVYWLGGSLATVISYIAGGWLNQELGWRGAFFVIGIPGLVLAVIVRLFVKEPRHLAVPVPDTPAPQLPRMKAVIMKLWSQHTSRHLCTALVLLYALGAGMGPWYAAFMMRIHGLSTTQVGFLLGTIFTLAGAVGTIGGAAIADRWFTGNEKGQLRASAIGVILLAPAFAGFLLARSTTGSVVSFVAIPAAFSVFYAPTYVILQRLVASDMRATTLALVMLFSNLIGMGAVPQLVGILSDQLRPHFGHDSLRYAMLVASFVSVWAAVHFWLAGSEVAQDIKDEELTAMHQSVECEGAGDAIQPGVV